MAKNYWHLLCIAATMATIMSIVCEVSSGSVASVTKLANGSTSKTSLRATEAKIAEADAHHSRKNKSVYANSIQHLHFEPKDEFDEQKYQHQHHHPHQHPHQHQHLKYQLQLNHYKEPFVEDNFDENHLKQNLSRRSYNKESSATKFVNGLTNLSGLQHITNGYGETMEMKRFSEPQYQQKASYEGVDGKQIKPIYEHQQENDYSDAAVAPTSPVATATTTSGFGVARYYANENNQNKNSLQSAIYNLNTAGTHNNAFFPLSFPNEKYSSPSTHLPITQALTRNSPSFEATALSSPQSYRSFYSQQPHLQLQWQPSSEKISDSNFLHHYHPNNDYSSQQSSNIQPTIETPFYQQHQATPSYFTASSYPNSNEINSYSKEITSSAPDSDSDSGSGSSSYEHLQITAPAGNYQDETGSNYHYQYQNQQQHSSSFGEEHQHQQQHHQQHQQQQQPDVINYVPYPVVKKLHVPVRQPVQIPVSQAVIIPISKPVPIHIPVTQQVQVPVEKELKIPVERVVPFPVEKPVPVPVEKRVPYPVVRYVPVKIPRPYPIKVPVFKTVLHKVKSLW